MLNCVSGYDYLVQIVRQQGGIREHCQIRQLSRKFEKVFYRVNVMSVQAGLHTHHIHSIKYFFEFPTKLSDLAVLSNAPLLSNNLDQVVISRNTIQHFFCQSYNYILVPKYLSLAKNKYIFLGPKHLVLLQPNELGLYVRVIGHIFTASPSFQLIQVYLPRQLARVNDRQTTQALHM